MSEMKKIEFILKPLKPLLFRRPVPFALGGYAPTIGPLPMPSTIAGMIRTAIMTRIMDEFNIDQEKVFNGEFKNLLGEPEKYSGMEWCLVGPYLAKPINGSYQVYYPAPIDMFRDPSQESNDEYYTIIIPDYKKIELLGGLLRVGDEKDRTIYSITFIKKNVPYESLEGKFVASEVLERYFLLDYDRRTMEIKKEYIVSSKDVAEIKTHSGIKLDIKTKTLSIEESEGKLKGMYYQFERVHYKKDWFIIFGIIANDKIVEDIENALDNKILRLGGKGGLVHVKKLNDKSGYNLLEFSENARPFTDTNGKDGDIKLVLTSPAVLEGSIGSYPEFGNEVYMYAAKSEIIGGWSYYNLDKPKPMNIGVKAGAVYLMKKKVDFDVFCNRKYVKADFRNIFGSGFII